MWAVGTIEISKSKFGAPQAGGNFQATKTNSDFGSYGRAFSVVLNEAACNSRFGKAAAAEALTNVIAFWTDRNARGGKKLLLVSSHQTHRRFCTAAVKKPR